MNTIKQNTITEFEIKKSKFITILLNITNKDEINDYLSNAKEKYKDATHYCYAYIIDEIKKASDDGEPSGTAGIPILEMLTKNNLNYVLCIVIRYFGGIKLGAGGLIRSYSKSVKLALQNNIVSLIKGFEIIINFEYSKEKEIDYLLKDETIINKNYLNTITYHIECSKDILNNLDSKNISYEIIKEKYIKKVD